MGNLRLLVVGLLLVIVLAACGGSSTPTPAPTETGPEQPTLLPAPNWVEANEPISRDNITQARYLGRLETPAEQTTVFTYAFSPDSTRLAGLNNAEVIVWDLIGGDVLWRTLRQNARDVFYSSDKTELYLVTGDGGVIIYDAEVGRAVADFNGHPAYNGAITQHSDGDLLVIGGDDGTFKVWDTFERQSLLTLDTGYSSIDALAISPDGTLVAAAGSRGAGIWRWDEREQIANFVVAGQPVGRLAFSPDGTQLAAAGNNRIGLWDIDADDFAHTFEAGDGIASDVLLFSPDGAYLISGGVIPDMIVWDTDTGRPAAQLLGVGGDRVDAAFSPDGELLITTVMEGSVTLWDMTSIGDTIAQAPLDVQTDRVLYVEWSADGYLMTFFDSLGPVYVWGVGGGNAGPNG